MISKTVRTLLEEGIHPRWLKAEAKLIKPLRREYQKWLKHTELDNSKIPLWRKNKMNRQATAYSLVKFLCDRLDLELSNMAVRREQYAEFNKRYSKAFTVREQRSHIIDFARELGASQGQLWGDKKAFSRWFGQDAMADRYRRMQSMSTRRLSFFVKRLGFLASIILNEEGKKAEWWQRLDLEKSIKPL